MSSLKTVVEFYFRENWLVASCLVKGVNGILTMPWLRRLVAGLEQRRSGFDPRPVDVGFVVDSITGTGLYLLLFAPVSVTASLHTHLHLLS
jgi:hypothetical protein